MSENNKLFLPSSLLNFKDKEIEKKYILQKETSHCIQVFSTALLTSFLYIIYSQLDKVVAPTEVLPTMTDVHLYTMSPILFIISLLAYLRKSYILITVLLILAPVLAALGNLLILSKMPENTTYLTENYLIIFWIFTISGLKLQYATISASVVFVLVLGASYFLFSFPQELFIMHSFWMLASFSFGYLGAYLIEKSSRLVFISNQKLEELAIRDKLTGLFNRTRLDEILQHELDLSQRFKHGFGFVILDIDYFKSVNDSYGHQVGDSVLIDIADQIKRHLRSTDIAVRWGGEEFIVIYLETEKNEVLKLADKLRLDIQKHTFDIIGSITASFGITVYHEGDDITSIIGRADKALYKAKENGRNSIEYL